MANLMIQISEYCFVNATRIYSIQPVYPREENDMIKQMIESEKGWIDATEGENAHSLIHFDCGLSYLTALHPNEVLTLIDETEKSLIKPSAS